MVLESMSLGISGRENSAGAQSSKARPRCSWGFFHRVWVDAFFVRLRFTWLALPLFAHYPAIGQFVIPHHGLKRGILKSHTFLLPSFTFSGSIVHPHYLFTIETPSFTQIEQYEGQGHSYGFRPHHCRDRRVWSGWRQCLLPAIVRGSCLFILEWIWQDTAPWICQCSPRQTTPHIARGREMLLIILLISTVIFQDRSTWEVHIDLFTETEFKNAAWFYPAPFDKAKNIKDHVAFCQSCPQILHLLSISSLKWTIRWPLCDSDKNIVTVTTE